MFVRGVPACIRALYYVFIRVCAWVWALFSVQATASSAHRPVRTWSSRRRATSPSSPSSCGGAYPSLERGGATSAPRQHGVESSGAMAAAAVHRRSGRLLACPLLPVLLEIRTDGRRCVMGTRRSTWTRVLGKWREHWDRSHGAQSPQRRQRSPTATQPPGLRNDAARSATLTATVEGVPTFTDPP